MTRPYRFGKFYAILTLAGAAYSGWFAYDMLWYGFFWAAVLSVAAVPLAGATGIGLWRKRRYGLWLLILSILAGIASHIYGWFHVDELAPLYRVAENVAFFTLMPIVFAYFWKRRDEFA